MEVNWINQFIILGALQGIILAVVVVQKQNTNKMAARFLMLLLLLTSLVLTGRLFFETTFLQRYWLVYTFTDIIIFLFGPIIYLFTFSLLKKQLPDKPNYRWHFLPALLHLTIIAPLIACRIARIIDFISIEQILFLYSALEFLSIISLIVYSWKSLQLYQQYEKAHYSSFSFPSISSFLKTFLYFFIGLALVWLVAFILRQIGSLSEQTALGYYGFWTLAALSTYVLSYKVLLNPEVLNQQIIKANKPQVVVTEQVVAQAPLPPEAKEQLTLLLRNSKIYKDPKLSLEKLAQALQMSRHEVSRTINQGFDKTFFDLINFYRIQEFIEIYQRSPELTFLEVAYSVGFNSKSAFNRAFRKECGTSPSDYFKNQLWQKDNHITI